MTKYKDPRSHLPDDGHAYYDVDLSTRLTGLKRLSMSQYWRVLENTACKK